MLLLNNIWSFNFRQPITDIFELICLFFMVLIWLSFTLRFFILWSVISASDVLKGILLGKSRRRASKKHSLLRAAAHIMEMTPYYRQINCSMVERDVVREISTLFMINSSFTSALLGNESNLRRALNKAYPLKFLHHFQEALRATAVGCPDEKVKLRLRPGSAKTMSQSSHPAGLIVAVIVFGTGRYWFIRAVVVSTTFKWTALITPGALWLQIYKNSEDARDKVMAMES